MGYELRKAMQEYWDACKQQKRLHADFFHAPRKYKFTKELNISLHLFQHLEQTEGRSFDGFKEGGDPPDVEATSSDGQKIGVEVTELVSEKAIHAQINGESDYCDHVLGWTKESTLQAIQDLLTQKAPTDQGSKHAFDRYIVLIHTDEFRLTYKTVKPFTEGRSWHKPTGIDEAYLLFSYDPSENRYPVIKLW